MRGAALVTLLTAGTALATPLASPPRVDPAIGRALETGRIGALARGPRTPGRVQVLVTLSARADAATLAALEGAGAILSRVGGRVLAYGRFVPAEVTPTSAARVAALPGVARLTLSAARGPMPLDRSAQLVRLLDARGAHPELGGLTGKGVTIADVDSLIDPFHPTFFRGDGGYFDWIDVDGDQAFTPGRDAIDLDRNGRADPGETAQPLSAVTVAEGDQMVPARPPEFDPGLDWLYLDANGNGARDYGAKAGFDDTTPALGEPLFVPDDLDRDGKLEVGERVVRLATSKLRKIYVDIRYPESHSAEYVRGTNLAAAEVDFTGGRAYGFADALHATGVGTILVGDVPLVGRRWVGIAPEAELVVAWDAKDSLPLDGVTWALAEKPDVMLHEMAPWTGLPLDGSDPLSELIDASTLDDGVVHTCPTGDQGSARKHGRAQPPAGGSGVLPFSIPMHTPFGSERLSYVQVSIHVRGGVPAALTLEDPSGGTNDLYVETVQLTTSGARLAARTQTTARNTSFTDVYLYTDSAMLKPEVGTWKIHVTSPPGKNLTVDAYASDDQSSWALGAAFDPSVATDAYTIGVPSTADHCLAVNAQPGHLESSSEPWFHFFYEVYDVPAGYLDKDLAIRAYSPRGPRIDGVMKPDVTAPDNPWVAAEHLPDGKAPYGAFRPFGGTSGASPHATGVAALLVQGGVHGDAVRDAIRAGAVHDAITGPVPNGDYGFGRLDAAGAVGVTAT